MPLRIPWKTRTESPAARISAHAPGGDCKFAHVLTIETDSTRQGLIMAKRKNRKKNNPDQPSKAAAQPVQAIVEPRPAPTEAAQAPQPQKTAKNRIGLSTCLCGMFMTFILGLYLGTLVPGILKGIDAEKMTRPPVAQESAPAANAKPIPEKSQASVEKPGNDRGAKGAQTPEAPVPAALLGHIEHLEKEATASPQDSSLWTELGNAYFDTNQYAKAIAAYERSLALAPGNPDVLTDLGIMYREEKNYTRALECFRKAFSVAPGHVNSLYNAGVVLSSDLNQKEEAAKMWQRILEINPQATTPDGTKISELIHQLHN